MRQLLTVLLALVYAVPAMAQVEFEADSRLNAEILSAGSGVTFSWEVFPEIEDVFLDGSATGLADASSESAPVTLDVDSVFDLFATVSGTAENGGLSNAFASNLGLLTVENTSNSIQNFEIAVNWSLLADTNIMDPLNDIALGLANIEIVQDFDEELLAETAISDLNSDQGRIELGDGLTLGFGLDPGQIAEFDFLVDADGIGSTFAIPEPNALVGLLLAFAAIASMRWQRRI